MGGRTQNKKARRLSSDSEGDDYYDMDSPQVKTQPKDKAWSNSTSASSVTASLARGPMRLTVKMSSSKLREATQTRSSVPAKLIRSSNDSFVGGQIMQGKRARTMKKSYALESDSEVETEIQDQNEEVENIEDDEDANIHSLGLEDADADAEIDIEIDEIPGSLATHNKQIRSGKKQPVYTKASKKTNSSTTQKQKQMQQDLSDDDELSELDSDIGEEITHNGHGQNIEKGEEENELDAEEENEEIDSDDPALGASRISTPDLNKLTRRQRARFEDGDGGYLMALPDEVQVKKHLTAEEHAMRRAEMARRRKNLSEKRNEEEKLETINKLLKKQAPKTNTRRREVNVTISGDGTPDDAQFPKPNPSFIRWVSNKDGNCIGVPDEWIESPVGAIFRKSSHSSGIQKM